jgi:hypothetical protein
VYPVVPRYIGGSRARAPEALLSKAHEASGPTKVAAGQGVGGSKSDSSRIPINFNDCNGSLLRCLRRRTAGSAIWVIQSARHIDADTSTMLV